MESLIKFFIRNRLFGDLLSGFLILVGVFSLFNVRREAFPNIQFDIITISTLYPGASPIEMEKLITNPIEQDLKEVDGIKKLNSISTEGRSYIVVQLDPDQTTEAKAKEDIKSIVDLVQLPEEAEDTKVVALETKQEPIIQVALYSDESEMQLREVAKDLEKKLEKIPGVARIAYNGLRDLEIRVHADPKKLRAASLSLDEMISAIRVQNKSIPAGTLDPDPQSDLKSEKIVRVIGEFDTPEDVGNTVIRSNELGQTIQVKDVARVDYDLAKRQIINKTNGKLSIGLTVIKKEKADAITVVDDVKKVVEEFKKIPAVISYSTDFVDDISIFIRNRLSVLSSNMILGIFLVCLSLVFFLPFKVSLIVSIGVVISFFGTIAFFDYMDYSLNLISLIGIIIVSGMLVDDAIVVTDNVARYMEMGLSPQEAAYRGAVEIWPAVCASILTIVVAFLPMMFMSGIFGKFVKEIPIGVIIALLISLAETVFIVPQHFASFITLKDFERPQVLTGFTKLRFRFMDYWDQVIAPKYEQIVGKILHHRYKALSGILGLLVLAVFLSQAFLKFILFPADGIEIFFIQTKTKTGITLEQAAEQIKPIEKIVSQLPKEELENYVTSVGLIQQEPNDPNKKIGAEYTQIIVYLTPANNRDREATEIIEDLRTQVGSPKEYLEVKFERVNSGPPVGKAISLGVQGETYEIILEAASELKKRISSIEGIRDVADSYTPGKPEILVKPIPAEAVAAGLDVISIGTTARAAVDGIVASKITRLDEELDIRVSLNDSTKTPSQIVSNIQIPNKTGQLIPLIKVARLEETVGILSYDHTDNNREVKVTSDVNTDIISSSKANDIIRETILPQFLKDYPKVNVVFGGEDEDTQESLKSLARAFIVAMLAIFLILILTFNDFWQPFLILLTIPMGIISVLFSLIIMRQPLSFMAMLGIIALAGVIVNNSIIFVDFVNQSRAQGVNRRKSILEAARIRLRPIFLTVVTTVVGVLPSVHGFGGSDPFVKPIAIALGYGLLMGSILTAFIFPAAIAAVDDLELWFQRKFR